MKRNFPNYAVGLDSTLEAIRKIDKTAAYRQGFMDAAYLLIRSGKDAVVKAAEEMESE